MYLEVLSNIKYARNIERILVIEVPESVCEIFGLNLPYPHEHKLMVGMPREEHPK